MSSGDQYAFEQLIKIYLKRAGLSQAAAARKLHYTPEQFNKWIRGVNRIPDVAIQEFSDLFDLTNEERLELFTLAGYVAVTAPSKNSGSENISTLQSAPVASNAITANLNSHFFWDALKHWGHHFFQWSKAPDHYRSNWTSMVIYTMTVITNRITLRGLLTLCISVLLGMATIKLMSSILLWPLANPEARALAYLQYALGTLLIPLAIAFVTPSGQQGLFQLATAKQHFTVWLLKFTGALVGFWVFSTLIIGLTLGLYYLYLASLPAGIRAGLTLIPLFFSYVVARHIPADRHKMFEGKLQLHPADSLFLVVFLFAGPLLALFLYFSYWFFTNRKIAPVILLLSLLVIFSWEYWKQRRNKPGDNIE